MQHQERNQDVFQALRNLDILALRLYLESGGDPNVVETSTGDRLLCIAAQKGELRAGELLLEYGAEPNLPSNAWPIHFAAGEGHSEFVELLLQANSEVHCLDEDGGTPLADASAGGHLDVVNLLLEAGADPTYKDRYGKRPILYAAEKGHREIVDRLSPFASSQEKRIVELRLKYGGYKKSNDAISKAIIAANRGDIEEVRLYIENGGDPNDFDLGGDTLLMTAALKAHMNIISYLLQQGADPNQLNENGACALSMSINAKSSEPYDLLYPLTDENLRRRVQQDLEKKRRNGFVKW